MCCMNVRKLLKETCRAAEGFLCTDFKGFWDKWVILSYTWNDLTSLMLLFSVFVSSVWFFQYLIELVERQEIKQLCSDAHYSSIFSLQSGYLFRGWNDLTAVYSLGSDSFVSLHLSSCCCESVRLWVSDFLHVRYVLLSNESYTVCARIYIFPFRHKCLQFNVSVKWFLMIKKKKLLSD